MVPHVDASRRKRPIFYHGDATDLHQRRSARRGTDAPRHAATQRRGHVDNGSLGRIVARSPTAISRCAEMGSHPAI